MNEEEVAELQAAVAALRAASDRLADLLHRLFEELRRQGVDVPPTQTPQDNATQTLFWPWLEGGHAA